jgi:hypothetical protein
VIGNNLDIAEYDFSDYLSNLEDYEQHLTIVSRLDLYLIIIVFYIFSLLYRYQYFAEF